MIEDQLRRRGIDDARVLEAFATVPRHAFCPPDQQAHAYADNPLPIGGGQTISQPYIVALTLQELDAGPQDKVLDVGSGSGYQTALLACLAGEVHAIERVAELAERARRQLRQMGWQNVFVHVGDGTAGLAEQAPFDRIVCGAAGPDVPPAWENQLAEGGRLVMPVGGRGTQTLIRIDKRDGQLHRKDLCDVRFVPLIGGGGWPE